MNIKKSETNNAVITRLHNVRKHPNADRIKLATVLGTQVIVDLNAKENDLVIYFDSNLRLSHDYLHYNNLYSNTELNANITKKGYFGKNGRVRAQRFRGEVSNGYVAGLDSLTPIGIAKNKPELMGPLDISSLKEGDEFTSIDGVEICSKYFVPRKGGTPGSRKGKKKLFTIVSNMFHTHWDTKQLMREKHQIPDNSIIYIEEKEHGTSGRTAKVLVRNNKPWWKFWEPKDEWKIFSGTRRVDSINNHISEIRKDIENKIAPHLRCGEEVYYEISGYDGGKPIQSNSSGDFAYGCRPGEYRAMLYRVTITTPDGFCFDLSRPEVYRRAEELGLEKPYLLFRTSWNDTDPTERGYPVLGASSEEITELCQGKSYIDNKTLLEGVVVWFQSRYGSWTCLKHKSEEFLMAEDRNYEKGKTDVEDEL